MNVRIRDVTSAEVRRIRWSGSKKNCCLGINAEQGFGKSVSGSCSLRIWNGNATVCTFCE